MNARSEIPSPRRGLRRQAAALYVGISASKFDEMVQDGRMPAPVRIDTCVIWDIRALDAAFEALAEGIETRGNDWDKEISQE